MKPYLRRVLAAIAASAVAAPLTAAGLHPAPALAGTEPHRDLTGQEVSDFLDTRIPELLEEQSVPGAAVSVVAEGQELFAEGYGEADPQTGERVVAERTAFPTASVAKSFTAAAVLQLADAGEVDLDADVNTYLPAEAQIADTYPGEPVTLHHLLTHTAGFEEAVAGTTASSAEEVPALAEEVGEGQPERIFAPGRFSAYSNFGFSVAALAVEEVSGQSFPEYTEEHLFAPLGMDNTAFAQHDDAAQRLDTPASHWVDSAGRNNTAVQEYGTLPAGGAYSTVTDMARFMQALLAGGAIDGEQALSRESVAAMSARQHANDPRTTAMGYGMFESPSDGPRVVGHDGDGFGNHAGYVLVPEHDAGLYIVQNSDGDSGEEYRYLRDAVIEEFLAEFFGVGLAAEAPQAADIPMEAYAGTYVTTRISHNDPSRLMKAGLDQIRVRVNADGTLHAAHPLLTWIPEVWVPVEEGLFASEDGAQTLAFIEEDGEVAALTLGLNPTNAYERVAWYASPNLHMAVAGVALLVCATVLVWPAAALVRRVRGHRGAIAERGLTRGARLAAGAAGLLCLGFPVFLAAVFANEALMESLLFSGSPLLGAPLAAATILAAAAVGAAALAWRRGWWTVLGRAHYTAVATALVAFLAVAYHYNLVW